MRRDGVVDARGERRGRRRGIERNMLTPIEQVVKGRGLRGKEEEEVI